MPLGEMVTFELSVMAPYVVFFPSVGWVVRVPIDSVLSPRFTPPEAYSVPLTFRLFRSAVPVERRFEKVEAPVTPSVPSVEMLPFVSMYVLPETSSELIAVAPIAAAPETLSEAPDTAPEEARDETLVVPAVNFDRPESPVTSSVPPTVVLLTAVLPETLSEALVTAPEEVIEETFVIPAVRLVSVDAPVTPNVPPTDAAPDTAAEASFVTPALSAEKVELPVMPSDPIEEMLPFESIASLPAPTLRDETPIEPNVAAPVTPSVPPTVAAPVTPSEPSVVLPAVRPASVDAPETESVPAEEDPAVLSEVAVTAPEERVPRIVVLPVVPLIVNLSVFTENEPPGWTERLSAATLVAETDPSDVVPAVRLVTKVALGEERDVVKLPVGADTALKVAAPAVNPASVVAPETPREERDVTPAVSPASVEAPVTPSVPPSDAVVDPMDDEPTVRSEALTAPAVRPESVVAPETPSVPAMLVFPVWLPTVNLFAPTRRSPLMFVAPVVVSAETSSAPTVVVPVTITSPENVESEALLKFPRTLTFSLMVVATWSEVVRDAENRLRNAARSLLIY